VVESDIAEPPATPPPPGRGWYRVPDNPNYERFWDGQKWTSQRYWGGGSTPARAAPHGPPSVAEFGLPPTGPSLRNQFEAAAPPQQRTNPNASQGLSARASHSSQMLGGEAPPTRFYSVTTIIVPPVFVGFFALIAVSAIPDHAGRPIGIGAAVLAVLFSLIFSRKPYVAIVRYDGTLMFKALVGSKETAISRVTRIALRTGSRGASAWIFQFDGTTALLGDIGGKALARYVIERNPTVEYPVRRFRR
jgi:hypothetical protein